MMKRLSLILILLSLAVVQQVHAQYYSVNYDARTVAAMATAFGTEAVAESYYREQVDDILKHYNAAEVATAGIFASKFLEHKAFSDLGIWNSSTENYYYRRIYRMVSEKIMPKIWVVAKLMLRSPQTAIYWGSYLMKICDETKSLCMQFESVVTNSTLGFSDIVFLEINRNIAPLLKLSEVGDIDWQRMLDDLASVPGNFTKENLQHDIDNLYNMGVGLASADDVTVLPVVDGVGIAVVLTVEQLNPASRPTGVPFRIGENLLPLRGIGIEAGIGRLETCPLSAVQYAVVVRRRVVIAQGDTPLLATGDIPPLRVVVSRCLVQIICHPRGKVVVAEIEQSRHVVLSAHHINQQTSEVMFRLLEERTVMVIQVDDLADPAAHQIMERTGLQQDVTDISDTSRGETDTHVVEVVDVVLQVDRKSVV